MQDGTLLKLATIEIVLSSNGVFPDQVIAELNKALPKYTLAVFRVNRILTFVPLLRMPQLTTKC